MESGRTGVHLLSFFNRAPSNTVTRLPRGPAWASFGKLLPAHVLFWCGSPQLSQEDWSQQGKLLLGLKQVSGLNEAMGLKNSSHSTFCKL